MIKSVLLGVVRMKWDGSCKRSWSSAAQKKPQSSHGMWWDSASCVFNPGLWQCIFHTAARMCRENAGQTSTHLTQLPGPLHFDSAPYPPTPTLALCSGHTRLVFMLLEPYLQFISFSWCLHLLSPLPSHLCIWCHLDCHAVRGIFLAQSVHVALWGASFPPVSWHSLWIILCVSVSLFFFLIFKKICVCFIYLFSVFRATPAAYGGSRLRVDLELL